MTNADVESRKLINFQLEEANETSDDVVKEPPLSALSVKLPHALPSILHADYIEQKALRILNTPGAIAPYAVIENEGKRKFMVTSGDGKLYTASVQSSSKISCDCKGFRYDLFCI